MTICNIKTHRILKIRCVFVVFLLNPSVHQNSKVNVTVSVFTETPYRSVMTQ